MTRESRDPLSVLRRELSDSIECNQFTEGSVWAAELREAIALVEALVRAAECPNANIIFRMSGPGYVDVPPDDWNRLREALKPFTPGQEGGGNG